VISQQAKMFTNWLTSETSTKARDFAFVGNPTALPPDTTVEVGPPPFARFPAHSAVLSTQSGFFRAAIIRASEMGKLSESPIYLPNITVDHFTPLLTYMYTGYLDLNYENIFGVLLATHLLHMPRALEICRDFLARSQRHQNEFYGSPPVSTLNPALGPSKVIRPIASKASNLGLNFISAPKASLLVPSNGTQFKTLSSIEELPPQKRIKLLDAKVDEQQKGKKVSVPLRSNAKEAPQLSSENTHFSDSDKVIVDVACCDGPVRFRRVLNEAYELNKKPGPSSEASDYKPKYHQTNAISFNQQMLKNINEQYGKNSSLSSQISEESENSQHSGEIYSCVYCKHTFKSKYCYQKHAKRHINPLNPLGKCQSAADDCDASDGEVKKNSSAEAAPGLAAILKRDSIKPLDMNVQYYPCKTCGCKFPSYYFVHKHRKLCHPEIAADGSTLPADQQQAEKDDYPKTESSGEEDIQV